MAMKLLAAAIIIGSLMVVGGVPAAGQSTADRDAYTQKAREDIQAWQGKLRDFNVQAEVKGRETGKAVDTELSVAWNKAAAASRRLQLMGADGWQSTKVTFEKAHHELTEAWRKAQTDAK
jgi:hypothetical protein